MLLDLRLRFSVADREGLAAVAGIDVTAVRDVRAFEGASEEILDRVAMASEIQTSQSGDALVRYGDVASEVHLLLEGTCVVRLPDGGDERVVAEFGPGDVVGEIAALTGGYRTATVEATSVCRSLRIPGEVFSALLDHEPQVGSALAATARTRLRHNRLISHLLELFPDLSDDAIRAALGAVEWVRLEAGETLFEEGDPADAAYILLGGRLRALRHADGHSDDEVTRPMREREVVGEIGRGEVVGEQALVEGGTRNATVIASRDAELARFPRVAFEAFVQRYPTAMLHVAGIALDRARHPRPLADSTESVITLVPAHDGLDLTGLIDLLLPVIERHRTVTRISSAVADDTLGRPGIAQADDQEPGALRLDRLLEELEDANDLVVLEADPAASSWTRRVARRAEHLVIVADANRDPSPAELERWLDEPDVVTHLPRRSLVLLHPPDVVLPRGTAAWLDARKVDRHHHIRGLDERDVGRLGRHLAGAAVGIALSGGGARGFGHVGAVRALMEHEVAIDVVAGASMGCAIGTLIAMDHRRYEDVLAAATDSFHKVLDYTLPVSGLITGKRIGAAVERLLGDRTVEDLPIPLLGVSTDLTRSAVAVHRRGDACRVVRASVAIPGVIPPVVIDGSLHVDGGVLDNLPMRIVRDEVRTGTVIAVDVAPPHGPKAPDDYGISVSGWRQLFDRITPGRRPAKVPGLATTTLRSMLVASTRQRDEAVAAGVADLYLQLGRLPCGLLEFDAIERVAEAGYHAANERVAAFAADREPAAAT